MACLHLRTIESVDALRAAALAWDGLWQRSETTIPTARAEPVALWLEHFAQGAPFRALVVDDGGRMVAALPLVERRACRVIRYGGLTSNYWSPNADLLLDPTADVDTVSEKLVGAIESLDWPLLRLDLVPVDQSGWQALVRSLRLRGLAVDVHHRWDVGQIALNGEVEAYFASRSKNLRRSLRRDAQRLEETAPLDFRFDERFTPDRVDICLREIFAIEDRSWKGAAGGSVLRHPRAMEFYRRQAGCLAAWDALRLARLTHGERTIAFDLGWIGHGVYHSYKVGYDPDYRRHGPGHLLRERLVRALAARGDVRAIDFQGPQTEALAAWSTRTYPIARLVITQRTGRGRALGAAYHALAGAVRLARKVRPPW